jgi:predicted porin
MASPIDQANTIMKRLFPLGPVLAAVLAGLAATSAQAQSSVTIYGRLNATVERQKLADGATRTVLQNNSSRIGFKGTEDMGGGLKAGFQLEHGFNVDTGTPSQSAFWARQSEVNVGGGFGTLRLGNFTSEAYYATADYISNHNHDTGTSADAFYAYIGRNINKIAYRAPALGPVTIEGAVSLHEQTAGGNNTYDLAANYQAGPLHLGAGYEKNDKANQFAVRVFYELGDFGLGAYVQRDENGIDPTRVLGKRTTVRLSAMYTLGLSEFHLNYGRAGDYDKLAGDQKAQQATFGYNYKLSKRTKVYGFYTKIDDKGALYGDFSSLALGVRHNF